MSPEEQVILLKQLRRELSYTKYDELGLFRLPDLKAEVEMKLLRFS